MQHDVVVIEGLTLLGPLHSVWSFESGKLQGGAAAAAAGAAGAAAADAAAAAVASLAPLLAVLWLVSPRWAVLAGLWWTAAAAAAAVAAAAAAETTVAVQLPPILWAETMLALASDLFAQAGL